MTFVQGCKMTPEMLQKREEAKQAKKARFLEIRGKYERFKYSDDIADKLLDYYKTPPYHKDKSGRLVANDYPTLIRFCLDNGIEWQLFKGWLGSRNNKKYAKLHKAYEKCKELALSFLIVNAQKKLIDPAFSSFCLKNLYQWADRSDIKANVSGKIGYASMVRNVCTRLPKEEDA